MSSRSGSRQRQEEQPRAASRKQRHFDENQNIDDMIDFITKKTVPDQKLSFMQKGKNRQRSKSGKQKQGAQSKRQNADDRQLPFGQSKKINQIAGVIGGMASQVAAEALNRKSSDGVILDITPAQISRRQQSQNALRKADFSVASQEFGFHQEKVHRAQRSREGSHDGRQLKDAQRFNSTLRIDNKLGKKSRPESGQIKIKSNDPRLKTLGQIYLQAQNRQVPGSQRNLH